VPDAANASVPASPAARLSTDACSAARSWSRSTPSTIRVSPVSPPGAARPSVPDPSFVSEPPVLDSGAANVTVWPAVSTRIA
jgi:hypothetical protein